MDLLRSFFTVSIGAIMMIKLDDHNSEAGEEKTEQESEKYTGLDRYISTHM